ncbi:Cupredoxin [Rhypophila decipiens]|uniref:Cupredoxin n=1 Tax=Rhypophila decipiens TaxID=261697 RepID=A0AAN7BDF5_9PEZI|nr:Cupredoxin [Rhypophila decipiens]
MMKFGGRHYGLKPGLVLLLLLFTTIFTTASARSESKSPNKHFEFTVTWEKYAPDGFSRDMILINGLFPGPSLEMDQGDEVEVVVHNKLPFNTTLHFHGIEMYLTPWADGVPGITQHNIQPNDSFTYKWKATQYGSYWYHAHHRGQLDDGMYGSLLIHPKKGMETPFELITKHKPSLEAIRKAAAEPKELLLSDFRHITSAEADTITFASNLELICYDSMLINGKGSADCWPADKIVNLTRPDQAAFLAAGNATLTAKGCLPAKILADTLGAGLPSNVSAIPPNVFDVCTPSAGDTEVITVVKESCRNDKWIALDVIGALGLHTALFSIDEISLWVYAVDGEYVEPRLVNAIEVTNGDRYSVLVRTTDLTPGDYTIRVISTTGAQLLTGQGTLSVRSKRNTTSTRTSSPFFLDNGVPISASSPPVLYNPSIERPFPPLPLAPRADKTFKLSMSLQGSIISWSMNGTIFPHSIDTLGAPILFQPPLTSSRDNLTITTLNNTWVDLIFMTATFPMPPHPIHKHGNKMRLIGSGKGPFKWETVDEAIKEIPEAFDLVNPPRRDAFATPLALDRVAWMAVRYHANNPGAWLLHCHIQSHFEGGMSMLLLDGVNEWPAVPEEYLGMT